MKKLIMICLCCLILTACGKQADSDITTSATSTLPSSADETVQSTTQPAAETEESIEATESGSLSSTESFPMILMVYSPDDALENFLQTETEVAELNEDAILSALIDAGVLTEDVSANSMVLSGTELQLDLNAAFRDLILTQGTSGERAVMGSLVNTFLTAYPDAQTVSLTVDGEILESGHVVYDFPLEFYK